jgi:hypothetical protein
MCCLLGVLSLRVLIEHGLSESSMEGSKCGVLNHKSQPWVMGTADKLGMSSTADKPAPATVSKPYNLYPHLTPCTLHLPTLHPKPAPATRTAELFALIFLRYGSVF